MLILIRSRLNGIRQALSAQKNLMDKSLLLRPICQCNKKSDSVGLLAVLGFEVRYRSRPSSSSTIRSGLLPTFEAWDFHGLPHSLLRSRFTFHLLTGRHFKTSTECYQNLSPEDVKKSVERLTDQFMEARELLSDAQESVGTVYFSQDMLEAQESVKATLNQYQELLNQLSDDQRQQVLRSIGLKMEELKAQLSAIEETLHDDH